MSLAVGSYTLVFAIPVPQVTPLIVKLLSAKLDEDAIEDGDEMVDMDDDEGQSEND